MPRSADGVRGPWGIFCPLVAGPVITTPRASALNRRVLGVDVVLIGATLIAAVIGVIMVYTATRGELVAQGLSPHYFLKRQAIFVVVGVVGMVVMALIDYRHLESIGMLAYGLSVFALVAVLAPGLGKHALGSQRWFPLGPFQLQPSEFAVLALILAVATFCTRPERGPDLARRHQGAGHGRGADRSWSWFSPTWGRPSS